MLDSAELQIPCAKCGHKIAQSIGRLKTHSEYTCPNCGVTVRLNLNQFRDEMRKVDAGFHDLSETIRDINRRNR